MVKYSVIMVSIFSDVEELGGIDIDNFDVIYTTSDFKRACSAIKRIISKHFSGDERIQITSPDSDVLAEEDTTESIWDIIEPIDYGNAVQHTIFKISKIHA